MNPCLQEALAIRERKLRPTLCVGKHPIGVGWDENSVGNAWGKKVWSPDEIERAFDVRPELNVGIQMGPPSMLDTRGVIDIEADSPEEEADFASLFEGVDVPVTPTFASKRGKHRLFAWHDRLGQCETDGHGVIYFGKLGCRIGAAGKQVHSCVPPSVNTDGTRREWLVSLDDADLAPLPEVIVDRLIAASKHKQNGHKSNGSANNSTMPPDKYAQAFEQCRQKIATMPPAVDGGDAEGVPGGKRTFTVACEIFRHGLNREDAAKVLQEYSARCLPPWAEHELQHKLDDAERKVHEAGEFGCRMKEPPCVTNVGRKTTVDEDGEEQVVAFPLSIEEIIDKTREQTEDWPRRVGNQLFVHEGEAVNWLQNTDSLFGYLHAAVGRVTWAEGASLVRRPEFQSRLSHTATAYEAVENLPHFPPRSNTYYAHREIKPGDGKKLDALLRMFCPATEIDGDLIKAAFATAFWGGPGGARPAFVFTSDDGRGVGKSTISKVIGKLCGGLFDFSNGEDVATIKKRLLTTESATTRVTLIDNIKSNKLSWAELESFVTAAVISGHRLYAGERTRPNTLLWTLTLNGPAMSRDMAQRSVLVKLKRPEHDGDWEKNVNELIDAHRWDIIADVAAFFASTAIQLDRHSRWGYWEREVLARLPEPNDAQQVILDRQSVVDVDEDEAQEFEEFVAGELERLGYDIDNEAVHIPGIVAREWMFKARGERLTTTAITRMVRQWANEGSSAAIQVSPSRAHGRGLRWAKCPNFSSIATDLERRIREDRAIFGGDSI